MKSIKDRDFYIAHKYGQYASVFVGIWDNPSIAHRDVKNLAEKFAKKINSTVIENKFDYSTQFLISDSDCYYKIVKTKIYDAKMQTG